ncbi:methionyl-tRNA formyltransferase [Cognatishimia sp. MH4019]|uniref:methionyl-tRNA formyltransferase n=1 Tax=Cognatishimia sp. MH4019 TaxID=2854030 RepID=UPI001CD630FF|nr:methionyl-tRNA formyltransferase [Cognatishimia sp. MH4019]
MKIALVGAVESTRVTIETLAPLGHTPDLLVTLPLDLAHRHSDFVDLNPLAAEHGIPVHATAKSNAPETIAALKALAPDLMLVIGWSQLCNVEFRSIASKASLGFHPSALPKLRGRAVIPWTILQGEDRSGASIFWLADGADTGDIAAQETFAIDPASETAASLYAKQMEALARMLPPLMARFTAGEAPRTPQDHSKATICARRTAEDGRIDWTQPADRIERLVRAVGDPYPGAFTETNAQRLVITQAQLTEGNRYIGLPGQVQAREADRFTVMCGDARCLDVLGWSGASEPPKLHSKLGVPA